MSQIATTIKQSKRLLAAGIDRKSCDMRWTNEVVEDDGWGHIITRQEKKYHLELGRPFFVFPSDPSIPAWSLSRLIDLIAETGVPMNYGLMKDSSDVIECAVTVLEYQFNNT